MNLNVAFFLLLFRGLTLGRNTSDVIQTGVSSVTHSCCSDVHELLKDFGAMKEKQRSMETRLKDSERRLKISENQILELKNQLATKIIFSARTDTSGAIGPFKTDTTVVYGTVITNVGNAYNQHTGIFTAPVPGTYYFTFFYHAGGEERAHLFLMRNNEIIVDTSDHKAKYDGADNGGNAAFLKLQRGDNVYVRLLEKTHVWGASNATTFSGFLIN